MPVTTIPVLVRVDSKVVMNVRVPSRIRSVLGMISNIAISSIIFLFLRCTLSNTTCISLLKILPISNSLPKIAMPRCPNAPYAIFIPATNEDAASAIRIIKEHDETFSILSGGHDYECQSGVANGVIIITSLLNTLEIDYDTGIATVGAGVLWQTVYDEINEEELNGGLNAVKRWGAMGAQCGLVSVSGFTLGGGMW